MAATESSPGWMLRKHLQIFSEISDIAVSSMKLLLVRNETESCYVLNERDFPDTPLSLSSIQSPTWSTQLPSAPVGKNNPCLEYDTTIPRDSQIRVWIMPMILAKNGGRIVTTTLYIIPFRPPFFTRTEKRMDKTRKTVFPPSPVMMLHDERREKKPRIKVFKLFSLQLMFNKLQIALLDLLMEFPKIAEAAINLYPAHEAENGRRSETESGAIRREIELTKSRINLHDSIRVERNANRLHKASPGISSKYIRHQFPIGAVQFGRVTRRAVGKSGPVLPPQASLPNCLSTSVSIIASLAATLRPADPTDRHRQRRRRLGSLSISAPAVPLYISEFPLPIPAFPSPPPTRRRSNFRANGTEAYPRSKLRDERQRCLARLFVNIFSCAAKCFRNGQISLLMKNTVVIFHDSPCREFTSSTERSSIGARCGGNGSKYLPKGGTTKA
ncbi:hypothetical protein EAG_10325 [Camponotus floridanus]|uniref:Uncharacterized protein n=1 Tax=Camponotus floridanus TaxID=104421 RepID=E2AM17_CAMFO|nr:hypothetical protein EAG_10325 [Camponotus floridanus]